jgi:hypothetical protein
MSSLFWVLYGVALTTGLATVYKLVSWWFCKLVPTEEARPFVVEAGEEQEEEAEEFVREMNSNNEFPENEVEGPREYVFDGGVGFRRSDWPCRDR